ncbi:MAG TPA: ATP-binding protein [Ktedonobacterales bacterium]|jgi:signal transduction histidine kinase
MNSLTQAREHARDALTRLAHPFAPASARASVGVDPGPSRAMFARIRRHLALVYGGVLAAILLVAGLVLYVSMDRVLLGPVNPALAHEATTLAREWNEHGPICQQGPFGPGGGNGLYFTACFDPSGNFLGANPLVNFAPNFLSTPLVHAALTSPTGNATDTIDGGPTSSGTDVGAISRYALEVVDPANHSVVGVIVVGFPIQGTLDDLHTLLLVLLGVGALTLVGSALGGAFLAGRALAPARLALERQQHFIADAAHELRTPLTLMRADAEVLLRGQDQFDPDDALLLRDIVAETAHMGALADNLLLLARLDRGTAHPERDVVDLAVVAADAARRFQALAAQSHITLSERHEGPVLVVGDRLLLEQAALILLDNALKYNRDEGSVTLHAYVAGQEAVLDVRDTGIGIPAEHLARLGERFYRVDKARSRAKGGAGLGVSIARRIAALHDGSLSFASAPGQGTTAALRLPAARQNPPAPPTA